MVIYWLVVWNMNFSFPYIGNVILPFDFHIFQRGRSTTNQWMICMDIKPSGKITVGPCQIEVGRFVSMKDGLFSKFMFIS